ncbi:hypothetical protein [Conexibacter woesei]|uniref:Uncharacterized protein n=1 Tax=Conexibacter woesei (strain DSM 14684 / CCUG 47730 / CIP 108061 / JCM 11494 / NBRC 100937 / ID131577) TaxID=469383 RepID=D3F572_CONWI|nr:hypothetical protein [Conexibacter woesei]ADB48650.1 hypothetical protein Cwoe_0214 [Conexibacter woesei DSM 14684]
MSGEHDDGVAVSYKALRRGTRVRGSDGAEVGKVHRVQDNVRENIFDGIVVETRAGKRFVDAPEVAHIAERAVTLTIPAADVAALPVPRSRLAQRMEQARVVRRARRAARDIRDR